MTVSVAVERHPVRNRFAHRYPCDGAHHRCNAFDVLNIQSGNDIDFGGEKILHVFVPFAVPAARNIRVGKFVHQHDFGFSSKDGVHIHLFEDRAFVLDLLARDGFDLRGELLDALAAVGFDNADDHVFAAAPAADALRSAC